MSHDKLIGAYVTIHGLLLRERTNLRHSSSADLYGEDQPAEFQQQWMHVYFNSKFCLLCTTAGISP